jgi:hypothetical protein
VDLTRRLEPARTGTCGRGLALHDRWWQCTNPVTLHQVTPNSRSTTVDLMLCSAERMLATSLLKDLRGCDRWSWGRRTWSAELSRCAIIAREENDSRSLPLLLRSLATSSGSDGPYSLRLSDALPIG